MQQINSLIAETNYAGHTYENKAIRSITVMVRNLHPSTSAKDIAPELEERS